jgi:hypothetical protein
LVGKANKKLCQHISVLVFLHTFVALHAWVLCRAALHGSTCSAKNQMKCSVFKKKWRQANFNSNFFKKKRVRVPTISMVIIIILIF